MSGKPSSGDLSHRPWLTQRFVNRHMTCSRTHSWRNASIAKLSTLSFPWLAIQSVAFVVPIEYRNFPDRLEVDGPSPGHAEAPLSGSEASFSLTDPASAAVSLEIGDAAAPAVVRGSTESNLRNVLSKLQNFGSACRSGGAANDCHHPLRTGRPL